MDRRVALVPPLPLRLRPSKSSSRSRPSTHSKRARAPRGKPTSGTSAFRGMVPRPRARFAPCPRRSSPSTLASSRRCAASGHPRSTASSSASHTRTAPVVTPGTRAVRDRRGQGRHPSRARRRAGPEGADLGRRARAHGCDTWKRRAGLRDRALLTLGWCGAFRRSELVALNVADVVRQAEGLVIRVRRSKMDQEGQGASKAFPTLRHLRCACPRPRSVARGREDQRRALFRRIDRHGRFTRRPSTIAASPHRSTGRRRHRARPERVAGHSLRSGFVTTASRKGRASTPSCARRSTAISA